MTQEEKVLAFLKTRINGVFTEKLILWGLNNYISGADRIARRLVKKKMARNEWVDEKATKQWFYLPQGYML